MSSINSIRTVSSPDNSNFISLPRFPRFSEEKFTERKRKRGGEKGKRGEEKEKGKEKGDSKVNAEHSLDDKYPEVSFPASNRSFFREDRERSLLSSFPRLFEEEKTRRRRDP